MKLKSHSALKALLFLVTSFASKQGFSSKRSCDEVWSPHPSRNQTGDTIRVSVGEYENRFKYYDPHFVPTDTLSREYIVSQAVLREPYPYLVVYFDEDLKIRFEEGRSDCDGFIGPYKEYRKNGILLNEGFRIGHKRYGDWKFYDKKGNYKKLKHYRKVDSSWHFSE